MKCFEKVYESFPNPLIWVSVVNGFTLSLIGIILGIDVWPSRFSKESRCIDVPSFYLFPLIVLSAALVWFIYAGLAKWHSSIDNRDNRGNWQSPIGFVIISLTTSIMLVLSSVVALRGWDTCNHCLIGSWRAVSLAVLIVGAMSTAAPMLYVITRKNLACGVSTDRMRYWFGVYWLVFQVLPFWVLLIFSHEEEDDSRQHGLLIQEENGHDALYWENIGEDALYV